MKCLDDVFLVLIVTIEVFLLTEGARILAVQPSLARSHYRFSQPLLKALARAGHEVVVYSPFSLETPVKNYTDVSILPNSNITAIDKDMLKVTREASDIPPSKCVDVLVGSIDIMFNNFILSDSIKRLLTSNERFDLLITEAFASQEFLLILGHIFKAPVISFQAFTTNCVVNAAFGNTLSIPYIPDLCSPFPDKMSLFERVRNTYHVFRNLYYVYYNTYIPSLEKRIKKYFPDAPPLWDMINNISLVFVNDHLTADYSRPRTPNIIPVGGIHIEQEAPLREPLQTFMDGASDGVIYFSLGTYVTDELNPQEYFDMYNNVFRQLKQRVLWKTRKENIQGLSDNVMTVKWAPQQDVLAHPKCVLFITHGGLLSLHETVYYGIPVLVIPQFFDQRRNGRFYEAQGIGVRLLREDLTESKVLSAIQSVIYNPQYTENAKRLSHIFRDRPMTPAETVVYWTEYVLKHGASHLKPASTQLSWYQLALLDVLAVLLTLTVLVAFIIYLFIRKFTTLVYSTRTSIKSTKKNN